MGKDGFLLTEEDRETLQSRTGTTFKGVYLPVLESMNVEENYGRKNEETRKSLSYVDELSGFMELTEEDAKSFGVKLIAGAYPDGQQNQIAISSYLYEAFCLAGYQDYEGPVYSVFDGTGKILATIE